MLEGRSGGIIAKARATPRPSEATKAGERRKALLSLAWHAQDREAFEALGFWKDDFPADGHEEMIDRFGEMGSGAWARFMDLTIAISAGEMTEMLFTREDGAEIIPSALIEAAAVPMDFKTLQMDRAELVREAMRRLVSGPVGRLFDDEAA